MKRKLQFFLNTLTLAIACFFFCNIAFSQTSHNSDLPSTPLKSHSSPLNVSDGHFIDSEGRQVLLHGLNVISKSKQENYLSWHRKEDFAKMRAWGMNCIRLGILWDGIEPQPGKYDESYLDGVAQRVAWAKECGLYVFLDMHQDLYSSLYSDGAPAWATLSEDKPHIRGTVWSDSYLLSPAVQVAFDNFWANAPATDGVGIQDHYAAAWRHVAERFANEATIIGYDLMNEPFEGSSVLAAQTSLLQSKFGAMLIERLGDKVSSPEELPSLWADPSGRKIITTLMNDITLYRAFVDAQQEHNQAFERKLLQPMYQRVANAIREVDSRHILLLETSYQCNSGVYSGITPVLRSDGRRDPLQAYVPHAYDIVVDTPDLADANSQRVELIFKRHGETAKRLNMPMIIGEWGAMGNADHRIVPSAQKLQREIEKQLCGDTYWDYGRGIENQAYFRTLHRSIPILIAGTLLEYEYDSENGEFNCRWQEDDAVTAPTIIYLTKTTMNGRSPKLEPAGTGYQITPVTVDAENMYLIIPPTGQGEQRELTLR